jgi:hypothetical protein
MHTARIESGTLRERENLKAFLELERLAEESRRPCSLAERLPFFCLLGSFDDLLMFAAAKVFLF